MNELDNVERESSSPLDFGVVDVITTTIVYLTCTVAVYLLCTFVEDDTDESATLAPDGTGTPNTAPPRPAASVASETPVAGAEGSGAASPTPPTPPSAAQPPVETGEASPAAVPDIMGREKRRR